MKLKKKKLAKSSSTDKEEQVEKSQYEAICEFIEDHNTSLMSLPKKKLKVSELAGNKHKYLLWKESSKNGAGTLQQFNFDDAYNAKVTWDVHCTGSAIKIVKELQEASIGELPDHKYQNVLSSHGFSSGIVSWVLEISEKKKGDVRIGVCKTKILNNDECFSNFAMGFAVSSDGFCKNGSNSKSKPC